MRTSALSHGALVLLNENTYPQPSGAPHTGPCSCHDFRFLLRAVAASNVAGCSGLPLSAWLPMYSCAVASSLAAGTRMMRSGAGNGLKPVLAAHQSALRSKTICRADDATSL